MAERKRVAVIGAGVCGLGALKSLKDEELEPVCFESSGHHGGLWRYHDDDIEGLASVMKTTIINISKEMGAMSFLPPPKDLPNYLHNSLIYDHMNELCEKFDLLRHVRYHHEAVSVVPAEDYQDTGRWVVTTKNTQTGEIKSETFDGVMVCIGHHVYPNIPEFQGMNEFQGRILHTHSLKNTDGFKGKRVVVIGVGNSGIDAAVEISNVAKQVYISSRKGSWVMPRVGPGGYPLDYFFIRRWTFFFLRYAPYSLVCSVFEKYLNFGFNHSLYNLKPKHRVFSQQPTFSDTLPVKLISGAVVIRGGIETFTTDGVIFKGEKNVTKADAIIMATGYKIKFPFLSEDILSVKDNKVELYKFIYPPHLPHPTLAILGLLQANGPGFPLGEMQCRWSTRVMCGKCSLPSKEIMLKDIREIDEFNKKRYAQSPRHTIQVEYVPYMDDLAARIGCKPNFWKMALTDPKLFWACIAGPFLSYQYRLQGPHAWKGARDAILTSKERMMAPLKPPELIRVPEKRTAAGVLKSGLLLVFLAVFLSFLLCLFI